MVGITTPENTIHGYVDYLTNTWLKEKRLEGCTNNTLYSHEQRIKSHITDFFRDMAIEDIKPHTIVSFYAYLSGKGLKPITIKKFSHILNNSFKFLIRDGVILKNPAEYVKTPKVIYAEKRALDDLEIKRLLAHAINYNNDPQTQNHNMYVFIKLALASGMRKGEMCALMWNCVDFKNNTITVKYSLEEIDGVCNLKPPKTNKTRVIAITPDVMAELQDHRKKYAFGRFVFPANNDKDEPMPLSSCFRAFKRIRNRAKLEEISIHQLRHTHATKLANSGVPVHVVRERLGHAALSTTMNYYVHSNSEQDKQAANIFNDL